MDRNQLTWVAFYMEFATKLLPYKNDRKSLIAKLQGVYQEIDMKFPKMESDGTVIDIDPFTVFGLFNKGITNDNRKLILSGMAKAFDIKAEVPSEFDGIPVLNLQKATFFQFISDRKENDISNLWTMFEMAIQYAADNTEDNREKFEKTFDMVLQQKGVLWNLTMGLYWIRPDTYINLDSRNREFIVREQLLTEDYLYELNELRNMPNGKQYCELCETVAEIFAKEESEYASFPAFSCAAWRATTKPAGQAVTDISKNTILYGPPGTGKTYNTVVYAVAIIENKKLQAVKDEDYSEVLARYHEYKAEELIEFTTFHQSYGYEEFIEGIKPVMDNIDEEQTDIQYQVSPGLFKRFCDRAGSPILKQKKKDIGLNSAPTVWKISLEGTYDNPTRTECMQNGHIRVGYDRYGENISDDTNFVDGGRNVINAFIYKMKVGDIVLSCYSATTIDAIGVVTGGYEWHEEYEHYKRLRKVDWIVKDIREDIVGINNGRTLTLSSVYKLTISLADVMEIIARKAPAITAAEEKKKNYVFVIDEINRGNISKIFGELITLIEPTKRIGQPEGMKAKLPYSQQAFGVPDNVYIIGTMNTADRSIATIDTALRRRFRFQEILPDAEVLEGIYVDDMSIKDMFIKMNRRIAVLYDREHTLGHAYFLPLKTKPAIETLASIFADSIIPLLQEYFYEDYEKIRLVLGDNKKQNREEQFIIAVKNNCNELFGSAEYDFDESDTYEINAEAFENIDAYRFI